MPCEARGSGSRHAEHKGMVAGCAVLAGHLASPYTPCHDFIACRCAASEDTWPALWAPSTSTVGAAVTFCLQHCYCLQHCELWLRCVALAACNRRPPPARMTCTFAIPQTCGCRPKQAVLPVRQAGPLHHDLPLQVLCLLFCLREHHTQQTSPAKHLPAGCVESFS